eukprot:NODE_1056_length_1081_cov_149.715116_g737_i0.p1 GENE.NODE_1056_length_1081_cov_149.715116_g737_i0~~NODE_1056_length_1081_cov_149.715116_g737_i0.p1  ORF type:complete len:163 (+),score=29.98 NODE_1056_length_1081_cov_149.715116_g737_i0:388-876(+)
MCRYARVYVIYNYCGLVFSLFGFFGGVMVVHRIGTFLEAYSVLVVVLFFRVCMFFFSFQSSACVYFFIKHAQHDVSNSCDVVTLHLTCLHVHTLFFFIFFLLFGFVRRAPPTMSRLYPYTWVSTYIYTYVYTYIYVYTYVYTYICIYICIYIYMYIYISQKQ